MLAIAKPNPEVILQELGNEAVLLHLQTEQYYTLDQTGLHIWKLLSQHGGNRMTVIASMLNEFDVDEVTVTADVDQLINEFVQEGLVNVSN
ncbi:MAG: PqqD family protein [Gammaproteobacteria bacterium]|nr:PqqD family protein [Gammaproteobacteria bacterium]